MAKAADPIKQGLQYANLFFGLVSKMQSVKIKNQRIKQINQFERFEKAQIAEWEQQKQITSQENH